MMKRIAFILTLVLLLVGCGGNTGTSGSVENDNSGANNKQDVVKLKLGHVLSEQSTFSEVAKAMAEELKKRSNGSIVLEEFSHGQLGGEAQMLGSAQSGDLDLVISSFTPVSNIVDAFNIFELPYLFDDYAHANEVLSGDIMDVFFDMLTEHGLVGLGAVGSAEFNVFGNKPVHQVSDLSGLKVRVPPSQGYISTFEALGAQPTPTEYGEVYVGLQQGTLDGGVTSPDQFINDKFIEVSDYYILTRSQQQQRGLFMSKTSLDKLTPEQQEIVWESAKAALEKGMEHYHTIYQESLAEMKNSGTEIIEPDLESFKQAAQVIYDKALQDITNGQELFNKLQEAIANK